MYIEIPNIIQPTFKRIYVCYHRAKLKIFSTVTEVCVTTFSATKTLDNGILISMENNVGLGGKGFGTKILHSNRFKEKFNRKILWDSI